MGNWRWSSGFVKKLKQKWFISRSKRCWRGKERSLSRSQPPTMLKQFAFLCVSCFRYKNHPALPSSWDTWKSFVPFKLHLAVAAVFISPLKVKLIRRRQIHEFLIPVIKKGRKEKNGDDERLWTRVSTLQVIFRVMFFCITFLALLNLFTKIFNPNSNLMAKTTFTNWISGSAREYWKRNTWHWITNIGCWKKNLFNFPVFFLFQKITPHQIIGNVINLNPSFRERAEWPFLNPLDNLFTMDNFGWLARVELWLGLPINAVDTWGEPKIPDQRQEIPHIVRDFWSNFLRFPTLALLFKFDTRKLYRMPPKSNKLISFFGPW